MLKYREIVGLGETAQELLDFARRVRLLDALLRSPDAGLVVVSLDEPVVRGETSRLVAAARARHVAVGPIVWNRVAHPPAPLPDTPSANQFFAEEKSPAPVGVDALRQWVSTWRALAPIAAEPT